MKARNDFRMVAKTFFGLENILADELLMLGAKKIKIGVRNVSFYGDLGFLYKCNISLRTAIKILRPIVVFNIKNERDLYRSFFNFKWEDYLSVEKTFSIESVLISDIFSHSLYVSQKAKDGIVDRFRKLFKKRPDVNSINPDIKINIHVRNNVCTVSLDSSGKPLNQRGYRSQTNIAPINEVLAAGLIYLSNWKLNCDLLDPMCGSGTILIEAAMIATNFPVNFKRSNFCFRNWSDFDSDLFDVILRSVSKKIKTFDYEIRGYDKSPSAILKCNQNIENAGMKDLIKVSKCDFFKSEKKNKNHLHIIFNPPYGERLPVDLELFYKKIGDSLKNKYSHSDAWFITSSLESLKYVGLKTSRKIKLYNGKLESRLVKYEIYEGKKNKGF
ncbi:MAG: class I SAM-dependent RNA methyltransferase [Flavobacteriaceae bacterium]